jgi:hypothetical protein
MSYSLIQLQGKSYLVRCCLYMRAFYLDRFTFCKKIKSSDLDHYLLDLFQKRSESNLFIYVNSMVKKTVKCAINLNQEDIFEQILSRQFEHSISYLYSKHSKCCRVVHSFGYAVRYCFPEILSKNLLYICTYMLQSLWHLTNGSPDSKPPINKIDREGKYF